MLVEKIESDFKEALKQRNEIKVSTLRMLKAAIKNKEIEKRVKSLDEQDVVDTIQKQVKQRKDSMTEFEKAKRMDLVEKEKKEALILEQYLPQQLSEQELTSIIREAINTSGAKTKNDMGRLMKELMPKVKGRADGKEVNRLVSSMLP